MTFKQERLSDLRYQSFTDGLFVIRKVYKKIIFKLRFTIINPGYQ